MNPTITLREATLLLSLKTVRATEHWCNKMAVEIFLEEGSNRRYIMTMQFQYARYKRFIQSLKIKYPSTWLEVFKIYTSMDIVRVVEMEESRKEVSYKVNKSSQSLSEHGKLFLASCQKI